MARHYGISKLWRQAYRFCYCVAMAISPYQCHDPRFSHFFANCPNAQFLRIYNNTFVVLFYSNSKIQTNNHLRASLHTDSRFSDEPISIFCNFECKVELFRVRKVRADQSIDSYNSRYLWYANKTDLCIFGKK